MASPTWSIFDTVPLERISRRLARWSRLAGDYGIESANGFAGLIALIALPAAFVASLAFSLPLAFPLALATINLSIAGKRRNAAKWAKLAELILAIALLLVAIFFGVLAVTSAARSAALAGIVLSIGFAALPSMLRFLEAKSTAARTALSRDFEGLDRLTPKERLVVVERDGRVAALSRAAMRRFAASGLKPGSDIFHLIDSVDRPILLHALDKAGPDEQVVSLRLNADPCPRQPSAARICLSLAAIDSRTIMVRLQDLPPALPDTDQCERSIPPAGRQSDSIDDGSDCDLEDAVRFAIRLLAGDADKRGVRMIMKERSDLDAKTALLVHCPARVARQIALNVIGNAIKFSHAGGQVTIETDFDGNYGQLCIRDQGVGIAKCDSDMLACAPKRNADRDRPGWGLGLAIVGDLVAGCDGKFFIKSAPGKGTAVTIQLPAAGMDREAGRAEPRTLPHQSREIARAA